jgi:alkaline phosphatase D
MLLLACTGGADGALPEYEYEGPQGPETAFRHGVASGDPLADAVIVWTRLDVGDVGKDSVEVFVEVATDVDFIDRVAAAYHETSAERDYTFKIDVTDLSPATTYYYRFRALGRTSPVGRTKTAPLGAASHLRFGVTSCSNYAYGYFHAYRHLANRLDLDAFIHLGDYIYEYASDPSYGQETYGTLRELDPPHMIVSLDDYRRRYAIHRRDPDLQELHRLNPIIHLWDDHEFACDPYLFGSVNHNPAEDGPWQDRIAAALRAHDEWMPVRMRGGNEIYRTLAYGELVTIVVVDRQRRFLWPETGDGDGYLGARQASWLDETIANVKSQWLLLATATTFGSRAADGVSGGWDPVSRERVLAAVAAAGIDDLVVVVGDIHTAQALDIVRDPTTYDRETGAGSAGVEFACNAISSPGGSSPPPADATQFLFNEGVYRGYLVLDVTPERVQGDFFGFGDPLKQLPALPAESFRRGYVCASGTRRLVYSDTPVAPRA